MLKGSKEFHDLQIQFEKDLKKMPVYVCSNPVRCNNGGKQTYYENGKINDLFIGYMFGYQNAKCMARLGEFD